MSFPQKKPARDHRAGFSDETVWFQFSFRRTETLFAGLAQAHLAMKLEFVIEIALKTPGVQ